VTIMFVDRPLEAICHIGPTGSALGLGWADMILYNITLDED